MAYAKQLLWATIAVVAGLWPLVGTASAQMTELLMFEAPGCPWCKRWHAEVGPGYPKSDEGKRAPLRVLPLDRASTLGASLVSPVGASPTFVLVHQGKEVGRIVGYPGPDFFWPMLAELVARLDRTPRSDVAPAIDVPPRSAAVRTQIASLRRISVSL